ncbi:hypothetical protein [Rhizobium aegyptiacum]|uniref:hypothetical protein n=1 Tax=Rhizobium aegyptiacum TaxID=1764550 RepID=UPI0007E532E6|nr:hypothetical protein [Rhizobium aegyptiacum]
MLINTPFLRAISSHHYFKWSKPKPTHRPFFPPRQRGSEFRPFQHLHGSLSISFGSIAGASMTIDRIVMKRTLKDAGRSASEDGAEAPQMIDRSINGCRL